MGEDLEYVVQSLILAWASKSIFISQSISIDFVHGSNSIYWNLREETIILFLEVFLAGTVRPFQEPVVHDSMSPVLQEKK